MLSTDTKKRAIVDIALLNIVGELINLVLSELLHMQRYLLRDR